MSHCPLLGDQRNKYVSNKNQMFVCFLVAFDTHSCVRVEVPRSTLQQECTYPGATDHSFNEEPLLLRVIYLHTSVRPTQL